MHITMLFDNFFIDTHPIWILIGNINYIQNMVNQYINSIMDFLDLKDIKTITLSKDNISDFDDFLSYYPVKIKILICILPLTSDIIISMLLKRLESIPKFTKLIIISNALPPHIISRGITLYIKNDIQKSDEIFELMNLKSDIVPMFDKYDLKIIIKSILEWVYAKIKLNIIKNIKSDNMIKLCNNLSDICGWMERGLIDEKSCVEMMISLIRLTIK